jgi:transcriptional regulator PpsR
MSGTASSDGQTVPFRNPARFLADLDPATTGRVIASAADIALVVRKGVIKDIALGNDELTREGYDRSWRDKPWIETVTVESRAKIEDLLRGDLSGARWRQVNHPSAGGTDVPVQYTAIQTGDDGRVVAVGRDLRSVARLQQRLVEVHQNLERDYARLREAEARYELLFHSISQPILIADPTTLVLEEANPAAARALGEGVETLIGASLDGLFAARSQGAIARLLAEAVTMGAANAADLQLKNGSPCELAVSAFRESDATRVIVRLVTQDDGHREHGDPTRSQLLSVLEELPDGLIVAGLDLRILAANRAFVAMTHLTTKGQMVGGRLSDFLGRSPTDLNVLISNLKNHGAVRNFATVLRDRFGKQEDVEVSAVAAPSREAAAYGFSVRNVARRLRTAPRLHESLPSSPDQLTGLVGRVPLKEIVRESTDFIEKLCIEAALEITDDNRASAAEMLGLSRQGFYTKMRRFGLDDSRG